MTSRKSRRLDPYLEKRGEHGRFSKTCGARDHSIYACDSDTLVRSPIQKVDKKISMAETS